MPDVPIQMYIDGSILTHDGFDSHEVLVHPVEVALLVPDIAVHFFLESLELIHIKLLLGLRDSLSHRRIAANVDLLGIISSAGKRRVDINQINLDSLILQISTGRNTLTTNDQITIGIIAHTLLQLHFVKRHPPLHTLHHGIVVPVTQDSAGTDKIIQQGLTLQRIGEIGDVTNSHK